MLTVKLDTIRELTNQLQRAFTKERKTEKSKGDKYTRENKIDREKERKSKKKKEFASVINTTVFTDINNSGKRN